MLSGLQYDSSFSDEEKKESNIQILFTSPFLPLLCYFLVHGSAQRRIGAAIKLSCHLNIAACGVFQKDWPTVVEASSESLKLDSKNVKGFYRHGLACTELDRWDEASADFKHAYASTYYHAFS